MNLKFLNMNSKYEEKKYLPLYHEFINVNVQQISLEWFNIHEDNEVNLNYVTNL